MTIGIIANLAKPEIGTVVPQFLRWLRERDVSAVVDRALVEHLELADGIAAVSSEELVQRAGMIVAFGGDGTILATARLVGRAETPILGVKIGGMGFLAELTPDELLTRFAGILEGKYELVERMVLEARLDGEKQPRRFYALNDFVLDKGGLPRVIRIKTYVDDAFLNAYIADGLIISTPTGSTAYSLAAGGPILLPSMEAIIINPISPHTLSARPVVIPGDKVVTAEVTSAPQDVLLSADGQVSIALKPGHRVRMSRADFKVKLVSSAGHSFFDVLHTKLHWGEDVREAS